MGLDKRVIASIAKAGLARHGSTAKIVANASLNSIIIATGWAVQETSLSNFSHSFRNDYNNVY